MTNKKEKTPIGHRTVMGFDFGTKSIGIAVGQEITGTANGVGAIKARDGIPNWDECEDGDGGSNIGSEPTHL